MLIHRIRPVALVAALAALAACGESQTIEVTPPAESGAAEPADGDVTPAETSQTTPATLPEVRYYQISDA